MITAKVRDKNKIKALISNKCKKRLPVLAVKFMKLKLTLLRKEVRLNPPQRKSKNLLKKRSRSNKKKTVRRTLMMLNLKPSSVEITTINSDLLLTKTLILNLKRMIKKLLTRP